jgi:hypothetical protein
MEPLRATPTEADVVASPTNTELVDSHRKLPHEVGKIPVVRIAARLATQGRHQVMGDGLPLDVEVEETGIFSLVQL